MIVYKSMYQYRGMPSWKFLQELLTMHEVMQSQSQIVKLVGWYRSNLSTTTFGSKRIDMLNGKWKQGNVSRRYRWVSVNECQKTGKGRSTLKVKFIECDQHVGCWFDENSQTTTPSACCPFIIRSYNRAVVYNNLSKTVICWTQHTCNFRLFGELFFSLVNLFIITCVHFAKI